MNEKTSLLKNIGYSLAGNISTQVMLVIYFIVVSRYLSESELGIYSYALSVVGFLFAFMDFGMSTSTVRDIARDHSKSRTLLPQMVGIKTTAGFVFMVVICLLSHRISPTPEAGAALRLMSPYLVLAGLFAMYYIEFQATEQLKFTATTQVFHRLSMLAILVAAVYLDKGVNGVIASQLIGAVCLNFIVIYITTKHYHPLGISLNLSGWKSILAASAPFMAMNLIWEVYNRVDQILIPYMSDMEANGLYAVAFRYAFMSLAAAQAVVAAVYPNFSRRAAESDPSLGHGMVEIYRYMGIAGFGVAAFTIAPAADWITLLSGANYAKAAPALMILACGVPMMYLNSINVSLLYAHDRHKKVLMYSVVSVSTNVVLDLALIPIIGYTGAAWATVACIAIIYLSTTYECGKFVSLKELAAKTIGPIVSAAAAGAAMHLLGDLMLPFKLAAGVAVFLVALFLTSSLGMDDVRKIRERIGR